jgi:peroxiredoxin/predicted 2-oxoglutarate/Fe(II)-dependent dioxygenase YbiX
MPYFARLLPGDPAPWFHQRPAASAQGFFDAAAGQYIVLCFFGTIADAMGRSAIDAALENHALFDDVNVSFFGVSLNRVDELESAVSDRFPGVRFLWDSDGAVSKLCGAIQRDAEPGRGKLPVRRRWVVLDPTQRVLKVTPFSQGGSAASEILPFLRTLPPPSRFAGFEVQAPILVLPNVFEPQFCRRLIELYEIHGGNESGMMQDVRGNTVLVHDHGHKRRKDYRIEDAALQEQTRALISRRVNPEILKDHKFKVTLMERYIVACYSKEDGGHFRAHRDNTTRGTAHRRFAVSVNLNADFEGGAIGFPEYGPRSFKAPVGAAVVFSCSLLHAVSPVTAGRRYAFLPFLYDDAAAAIRQASSRSQDAMVGR